MKSTVLLLLVCSAVALAGEEAPWLEAVSTDDDRTLLEGLLAGDEDARKASAEQWEKERLAFMEEHGFPGWPRDELDPEKPRHAFEARKVKVTNGLVLALEKGPPAVRRAACLSLADLRPAFENGREALGNAIDDEEPGVRVAAITALLKLHPTEGGRNVLVFVPQLVERILDPNPEVRQIAIISIHLLLGDSYAQHELARKAAQNLEASTQVEEDDVRAAAYAALGAIAPREARSVPVLRKGLHDASSSVRRSAAGALAGRVLAFWPDEVRASVPRLRELLTDSEFGVRWAAAVTLWEITETPDGVVPVCAEALERLEGVELAGACRLICRIGPDARSTAPALATTLGKIEHVRHQTTGLEAWAALLSVGPTLAEVQGIVRTLLASEDPTDRWRGVLAIQAAHGTPDEIADRLLAMLEKESDEAVSGQAHTVLAERAPERARVFVPEYCQKLRSETTRRLHWTWLDLLGRIGTPEAVACIAERLDDPKDAEFAWRALMEAGAQAAPALRAVVNRLDVEEDATRAAQVLALIGAGTAPAVARLTKRLSRASAAATPHLSDAIRQGGGEATPCIKALVPLLRNEDENVRATAARALGGWGETAAEALSEMEGHRDRTDVFDDDGDAAAVAAARMGGSRAKALKRLLGHIRGSTPPDEDAIRELVPILGAADAEAVPDLVEAALYWRREFHKQPGRTIAALDALARIGPPALDALPTIRSLGRNMLFKEAADKAIQAIDVR